MDVLASILDLTTSQPNQYPTFFTQHLPSFIKNHFWRVKLKYDEISSQSVKASTTLLTALPNMEGANGDLKTTLAAWQMPANSYLLT